MSLLKSSSQACRSSESYLRPRFLSGLQLTLLRSYCRRQQSLERKGRKRKYYSVRHQFDQETNPVDHLDYVLSALEDSSAAKVEVDKKTGSRPYPSLKYKDVAAAETVMESLVSQSLVSQVKDLLPHLGEGFIEICLREFGNNPETVINKILEDSLPPHLKDLDFTQPAGKLTASCPDSKVDAEMSHDSSLIHQRKNVFDNDEFDVFRKPEKIDLSLVHIGKKFDSVSTASMLNDKTHLEGTRERYDAYTIETACDYISEEQASKMTEDGDDGFASGVVGYDLMYEDEYDDTYDSQNVGAADDATDEQFIVKRLNKKGLAGMKFLEVSDEEEDSMRYPNVSKKHVDGRSHEQSIALKSAKDLISSISGLSGGGRPQGSGKFGKHGHEAYAWRSGPRDQDGWKSRGKEGWKRDDEDYRRGDRENWRSGGYDSHAKGTKKGVSSKAPSIVVSSKERVTERNSVVIEDGREISRCVTDKEARPLASITQRRDGDRNPQSASSRGCGERNYQPVSSQGRDERNPPSARDQGHGERNPPSARDQGRGERNPPSARDQGRGERNPPSARDQGRGERNPPPARDQGRGEKNPPSARDQGRGERNPQSARDQGRGEKNPPSASAQGRGEKNPPSASAQGHGEKNPPSASAQGRGEKNPPSASAQGRDERSSKPDSTRPSESRARQAKDRNKGSRANHNRRDLADKKRRGGML